MTGTAPTASRAYDLGFTRWVYQNVEGGERLSMCMQCGVCSGSCPIAGEMDHGPRKLFMMVRAGMKEAVLRSNTLWNCVKCYRCVVRCPREVPVTYILSGLGTLAVREGYAEKQDTESFAKAFWWSARSLGRTDERLVTAKYYFSFGLVEGIKKGLANLPIALAMIRTKRMHLTGSHKIKDRKGLKAILAKAAEIESRATGEGS
jgi:quinone-modifying oxidoreductase subunit QmoC